ncbi:kelch-like protein 8 isoform X1 [Ruditapes philippinarum]|uniref:kelch-like protein 8 isoform X1 n=1 Tax=Ruditapes philippinarum TaxID=129788 RepID=UPI00295BA67B|nr:kelch-like protein 8 isoform X1 [Ruditapes philippinarum]XP_060584739.1 kelch-like protein 8 isoform X1 [Ruditapes philippinarum]XP_060584740.1 kelch-like protein 8 isoform X1 [Ruditapes philippinarum]XP_060584741.1 kelch-like protein 8 isoform X1 [Ruditapes philippinarum]
MSGTPPIPERVDSLQIDQLPSLPTSPPVTESDNNADSQGEDSLSIEASIVDYETPNFFRDTYKTLNNFRDKGELCDVEIQCGQRSFKCHRILLASISGYFRAMFMGKMAESKQNVIKIQDIDENILENMIKYAYSGKVTITVDNVQGVLYVASILQIENVAHACSEFMKEHLHPDNCVQVHGFAMQHNREQLIRYTQEFITDNFNEVSKTPEFMTMSADVIDGIVSSSTLNVSREEEVFEAVMQWINHDKENRKQHLPRLLGKVKLPLISTHYLMNNVATNELVRSNLDCRDFLDEAKYYQMYIGNLLTDMTLSDRTRPRKSYAGVLFCVGGRGASGDPYKTIECYHPMKDRWYQVTEMHIRRRHVGVCCFNGQIYAVGGHNGSKHLGSGEVFDPTTAKWRKMASMVTQKTGVRGLGLACLGGAIYAVGGLDDKTCFDTVERYDPVANSWTQVASMNLPRGGVGVAALKGYLYAIGGNDGSSSLNKCECYDPYVNKWTIVACMGNKRAGAGVGVLDGYIYAVGGFDDNASLDTCERFDPRSGKWTPVASLSCPRGGVGVAALGGRLYAVGGHDGCNYLNSVESYNPITDSWEKEANIEISRAGAGVVLLPGPVSLIPDSSELNYFTNCGGAAGKL